MNKEKQNHTWLGSFKNLGISSVRNTEICNHNGFKLELTLRIEEVRYLYRHMCLHFSPALVIESILETVFRHYLVFLDKLGEIDETGKRRSFTSVRCKWKESCAD